MSDTVYSPYGSTSYQTHASYYDLFMEQQYGSFSNYESSVDAFWAAKLGVSSSEYTYLKQAMDKNNAASSQYNFYDSIAAVHGKLVGVLDRNTNLGNVDDNILKDADNILNNGLVSIGGPAAKELAKYVSKNDGLKGLINSVAKEMGLSGSTAYQFSKVLKDYSKLVAEHATKLAIPFVTLEVLNDGVHGDYYAGAKHFGGFVVANATYNYGNSIWDATYKAAQDGKWGALDGEKLAKLYHSPLAKGAFVLGVALQAAYDFELAVELVKQAQTGHLQDDYGFLGDAIGQKAQDIWDDIFDNPSTYPQMETALDPLQGFWNGMLDTATDPAFWLPSWLLPGVGMHGGRGMVNFGSPLILDLDGDGAHSTKLGWGADRSTVYFDMDNDGFAERTAWVSKTDGLLALDRNGNGKIDGQGELFGNSGAYADGFLNLKQYDSNADNKITSADTGFANLRVWVDADGDGQTDAGELKTLAALGITQINLAANSIIAIW